MYKILSIIFISGVFFVGCGDMVAENGKDGANCVVKQFEEAMLIQCPDGSESIVYNGKDGLDGINGKDGNVNLKTIDPCGDEPNYIDEVLLILNKNVLMWDNNDGLFILEPYKRYRTNDHQRCYFMVQDNGKVVEL